MRGMRSYKTIHEVWSVNIRHQISIPDGTITNKFILVLCDFGSDWLVVQTTQQPLAKNRFIGCQINDKPPNYYIPKTYGLFTDDTWIRLDEVFEYNADTFFYKRKDGIVYDKGVFNDSLLKDILQCALKSDDIDIFYLEFLERCLDSL